MVNTGNVKQVTLGKICITAAANEVLQTVDINNALARHITGDYGKISKADWKANDNALKYDDRILSEYTSVGGDRFWIITEADRSYTTILLPSDY